MTYHKGDEIAIYGALAWDDPEGVTYTIEDLTVKVVLKDNYGNIFRTFSTENSRDGVVVDGRDNSVALLLTADITNELSKDYKGNIRYTNSITWNIGTARLECYRPVIRGVY